MGDRKKKYISYKDNTRRAPIILSKHDRDVNDSDTKIRDKDASRRDKSHSGEKDAACSASKQPVILIKAREDVQRSASPTKRVDSKVNDNTSSIKAVLPSQHSDNINSLSCVPRMSQAVKLIDEYMDFNTHALDHLLDAQNDYLVVGVLGVQGVGKSTIMNLIAQTSPDEINLKLFKNINSTRSDIKSHNIQENGMEYVSNSDAFSEHSSSDLPSANSDRKVEKNPMDLVENDLRRCNISDRDRELHKGTGVNETFKFKTQSTEQIQQGQHCTNGIDMYITVNRIILLDSQPVLSASRMDKMVSDSKSLPTESAIELESLYLATFMLATCHVIILVQDWFADHNIIRFLQTAEMLKPTSSISNTEEILSEHYPHLLLLHNKATMTDFLSQNVTAVKQFYATMFSDSKLSVKTGMGMADRKDSRKTADDESSSNVNVFLFPEILADYGTEDMFYGHDSLETIVDNLRQRVFGVNRSQIGSTPMSEKHWGHYASKTWDTIHKSGFFNEYIRLLP